MSVLLRRVKESAPASWPDTSGLGLSTEAAALDDGPIWSRLNQWTHTRWVARTVVWTAQGCGTFAYPLTPVASLTKLERWDDTAWTDVTSSAVVTPFGLEFSEDATWRITVSVGDGSTPPDAVLEAFRRLAEYYAESADSSGLLPASFTRYAESFGDASISVARRAGHTAQALSLCGAADLLRPWHGEL